MIRVALKRKPPRRPLSHLIGDPGRPKGVTAGSWINDLMALRKAVMLCGLCVHRLGKATLMSHGFRKVPLVAGHNHVISDCDDCRRKYVQCTLFQKQER